MRSQPCSGLIIGSAAQNRLWIWMAMLACHVLLVPGTLRAEGNVFLANGVKIGEVTHDAVILWTRVTQNAGRNLNGHPFDPKFPESSESAQLQGRPLESMEGAVPGCRGEVRAIYWPEGAGQDSGVSTPWQQVDGARDYTCQMSLTGLTPATSYRFRVEGRSPAAGPAEVAQEGRFKTAPKPAAVVRVSFTVVTGQDYPRRDDQANGHRIYPLMRDLNPDFLVHTGDIEYYDKPAPWATSVALARFKWNRLYALPFQRAFHREIPAYFMRDDHDTLKDDCWPGQKYWDITWEQGLRLFREQFPLGDTPYRTFRWGRDLQIWLVEGREFRSPNTAADGPGKTIWGKTQKQWFFDTVKNSDATFRVLISPTPLVGPDRSAKRDNHSNRSFAYEGKELRRFMAEQKNMFVICGDRHWQYASVDPETGLREFSCGPTSDKHAEGFSESQRSPAHRYLKIRGGFLSATIERVGGKPQAILCFYGVDGTLFHQEEVSAH